MKLLIPIIAFTTIFGCSGPKESGTIDSEYTSDYDGDLAVPHPDWVNERVAKGEERLKGTESGELVLKSINYHGGLKNWYNNGHYISGSIIDHWDQEIMVRDSYQTVEYLYLIRNNANQILAENQEIEYDGMASKPGRNLLMQNCQ